MGYFQTIEISAAGMTAQKARVEAAALNLANMNTSIAPGTEGYRPLTAVIQAVSTPFSQVLAGSPVGGRTHPLMLARAVLAPQIGVATRTAYEPGHPHADAQGMVSYPAVDHTQAMITMMTALRAYEANLAALQATKTLAAKALDIGSP